VKTIIFAVALALVACGKKNDDKPAPPPPPPTTGSAAMGSGSAAMTGSGSAAMAGSAAGSDVDVPTEMDFEAAAKSDVTDKTVEAKVKAIEDQLQ